METNNVDLGPVAAGMARLAEGIDDAQLGDATPCPAYTVRELLAHVVGLCTAFRDAGRKDLGPTTDTDPETVEYVLDAGWRTELPRLLEELTAAWRRPDAWEGFTRAGGIDLPASVAGQIALNELLVHGWDLARATGQDYAPDEASLAVSYALLEPDEDDQGREGMFGPVVPVGPGASLRDRVIGLSGRRPDWKPGK
ncbi:TIGR03086 family metal-binding protein [Streptomyces sp. NPDC000410]|uniref:TIGR03086 family metal-binding protein n=1 Tax=Streptomyces sp. NPDC000410 TaxID=3154254 RepID=UPI003322A7CD